MSKKSWQKIIIHSPSAASEAIASFVTDLTGSGVEIGDDDNSSDHCFVIGYLPADDPALEDKQAAIRAYLQELPRQLPEIPAATLQLDVIKDQDWHSKWKKSFKPFHLSATLVVKPSWEEYTPTPDEKVIEIDPGMAFGTGLHASTRLATELMENCLGTMSAPPAKVLDVGTGTGILAIGAALCGCKKITAIDNDPEAITAAVDNIAANRLTGSIEASTTDLATLTGPYDLILANIIHNTLVEMAPRLTGLLARGGILILAGILTGEQDENIKSVYCANGLTSLEIRRSGEWSALGFRNS